AACTRQHRQERQNSSSRSHHCRPYPSLPTLDHDLDDFFRSRRFRVFSRRLDKGGHQYTVIRSDTSQIQESDPDRHRKIDPLDLKHIPHIHTKERKVKEPTLSIKPDHDKSSCKSNEDTAKHH